MGKNVTVTFQKEVTIENLDAIFRSVAGHFGCQTCGLQGLSLQLMGPDPEITRMETKLKEIVPGVTVEIS